VIIDDFHVAGISTLPAEADPPLVVDPNAVLALSVTAELFKVIRWWNTKVIKRLRSVQDEKFTQRHPLKTPKLPGMPPLEDFLGLLAAESLNHELIIT
jgi:hypothetical protein